MHGMLSLAGLVAAFAGVAGWAGYMSVRLFRACPAGRLRRLEAPRPAEVPVAGSVPDQL
ncbi:MAG TPA: hypothetical protein VGL63_05050 [Streptosporangiaceae bacterium]|jgi:hypothetical protein